MSAPDSSAFASRDADKLPVNFAQFMVSLGSSALVHLGELADPVTGKTTVNLSLAHHTIGVLELLRLKTVGNLDDDESKLIDALLSDLHRKYLGASQS
ncbi:MAG: DUF1844 domain-containing protein [Oligoflexia bacterium]|nr:DUF1844 domain-containing protein [Oligoflexia bacterium]